MKYPALTVLGMVLLLTPAPGTILLNEIHLNVPDPGGTGSDSNYEFIELRSTTDGAELCDGLTILIIDNNGGQVGEVREAYNLTDLSTGANGLLLIGNNYGGSPAGGPWSGFKDLATATGDPSGAEKYSSMGSDDIGPNGGLTVLLVLGWKGLTNAIPPTSLGDVDAEPDGGNSVVDWTPETQPYTTLVDSVGFSDLTENPARLPYCPTTANLSIRAGSAPNFPPASIARRLSRASSPTWANNSAAWYGARIAGTARDSVAYDVQFFGDFKGQATPGKPNLDAAPLPGNFLINEVEINPSGSTDGNFEYIEILNTVVNSGSLAASLQGYSLLLIGSSSGNQLGKITEAWDLGGMATGANGLLLLGNDYPAGRVPWGKLVDPLTQLGDPDAPAVQMKYSGMGDDDLGSNNGFTLLLVRDYTGTIGQTVGNAAGVLTAQPWAPNGIADSVGFDEIDANDNLAGGKSYAPGKVDPTYLSAGQTKHYNPDHLARKLGTTTANSAGAWYGGKLAARNPYGIALRNGFFIGGFRGEASPGGSNLSAAPPPRVVRLNEVHLNPPTTPTDNTEFIEIVGFRNNPSTVINPEKGIVGLHDLWLLVVGANAPDLGVIRGVLDLRGISTGPNGLAFLADGGEELTNPWVPFIAPQTLRDDPVSYNDDSTENTTFNFGPNFLEPNSGAAILLVRGFTGALNQDLDADNNSTFDVKPWSELVDSISFGTSVDATVPLLTFTGFNPGNLSRYNGDATANFGAAWFGGELQGPATLATSTNYSTNWTGTQLPDVLPFQGAASPGRLNHSATPDATASMLLNEININPIGGDNDREFIELTSSTRQSISSNGYTILLLDVDGPEVGKVLEAWSLDGLSTGLNGLLLTGSGYTTSAGLPWTGTDAIAAETRVGSPAEMDFDDIGRTTDNGAVSVLLVKDFSGRVGDDLDTLLDDGILDTRPWRAPITDAVGLRFWDAVAVPPAHVGRVYGGVDLSQSGYTPDNVSRYMDKLTANSVPAWYGGDISGTSSTSVEYDLAQHFPSAFTGAVTPGKPNLPSNDDLKDDDFDTAVNLIELALGMTPTVPDAHKLPATGTLTLTGTTYPIISFTRPPDGTSTPPNKYTSNGLLYTVQFSLDLVTWSDGAQLVSTEDGSGNPPLETATYRPTAEAFAQGQAAGQMFLRLQVTRQ